MARRRKAGVIDADFTVIDGPGSYGAFNAAPTPAEVPQLSPEMKSLLKARMQAVLAAEEYARQKGLTLAQTATIASALPLIGPLVNFITTPIEGKIAVMTYFQKTVPFQIAQGAVGMDRVMAGSESFDHWLNARKVDAQGMVTMLAALGGDSAATNLAQTISDVGNDVAKFIQWFGNKARELPDKVPDTSVLIYLGLALGGIILYQYATAPLRMLPRRQVAGYIGGRARRPRRTRTRRIR